MATQPSIFNEQSSPKLEWISDLLTGDGKEEYASLKAEVAKRPQFMQAYWNFRKSNELGFINQSKALIDILAMARMHNATDEEVYDF